ncbi:MAG: hypothetical protein V1797_17165 [Pseudomonadota bacterium]
MKVNPVRKAISEGVVSFDAPQRRLIGVASTSLRDRQGDVVEQDGWELGNFMANPVIVWAHDYSKPAVAQALRVWPEAGRLLFEAQFPPEGQYPFADQIYRLYQSGVLRAFSAGFNPLEASPLTGGGRHYRRQELYEISCANIPINPQALAEIVKGIDCDTTTGANMYIDPAQAQINKMLGISPEVFARYNGPEGIPPMMSKSYSPPLGQEPIQDQINKKLGILPELFAKHNGGQQTENIYDVAKAVLRERPY